MSRAIIPPSLKRGIGFMDAILIRGGNRLTGDIPISGAKNAALPLMVASLLTPGTLTLTNMPALADIAQLSELLRLLGVEIEMVDAPGGAFNHTMTLKAATIRSTEAPYDLVRKMRASFFVLGPLLARAHKARVSLPGGCAIGQRPVDLHIKGLEALGAKIELEEGYVVAEAPGGLKGGHFRFPVVSVGASENVLMAAALAEGETVLENVALEPEVQDVARLLVAMGVQVDGIGTRTLRIQGKKSLPGATFEVLPDRIEAGTFAMAVATTGGDVELVGARYDDLESLAKVLEKSGVTLRQTNRGVHVYRNGARHHAVDVTTEPFPGFPTDMQAQLMAFLATADGVSTITETIFENRFMHVPELNRLGAKIETQGQTATVTGTPRLKGAPVMATDLRASVGLVIAALAAEGETRVNRVYHLDRGFERLEEKLRLCGADIERVKGV
ncbi:MAG: UDP-N-acetylglucosamine 1-carboxyvinyltransferase [Micropepsaceae bacterium]